MNAVKYILPALLFTCLFVYEIKAQPISWQLVDTSGQFLLQLSLSNILESPSAADLQVFVGEKQEWPDSTIPAVLGAAVREGKNIFFRPSFPFREGVSYTAFWKQQEQFSFIIPRSGGITELSAIYPSTDAVPSNLLKIYLHFSAPMGEGRAYEHLTLISADGDTIRQPFVPLQPELWSEDRMRLTLWLDPGRVKRGLLSHETHGAVLREGEAYRLEIDPGWKDARGRQLGKSYRKAFQVIAADYQQPQPDQWKVQQPKAGSTEPLIIDFDKSLDHALAGRYLRVIQGADHTLPGEAVLEKAETRWSFYPAKPWTEGAYTITINSSLEDLAGNNLNRPFDREIIGADQEEPTNRGFQTLEFTVNRTK